MQPDALADLVVLTVKTAMAPYMERLAAAEARVAASATVEHSVSDLRDRTIRLEAKTETPVPPDVTLRDRVLALETKAGSPIAADLLLGDMKARVVALEARAMVPGPAGKDGIDGRGVDDSVLRELREKVDAVVKDVVGLRERVAVAEVRAPMPGPPGPAGRDGKDGTDGLGFNDLVATQDNERTFTIKAVRGDVVKTIGTLRFPVQIQRGVYVEGKAYELGDVVTWGGSQWHCNEDTTAKPGENAKAWTLVVKRGRDGKDGRDGHDAAMPVVRVS